MPFEPSQVCRPIRPGTMIYCFAEVARPKHCLAPGIASSANLTALPVPVTQNTSLPGKFKYVGCLASAPFPLLQPRFLLTSCSEPGAARVFPYQIINTNNNTATACLTQCAAFGYPAAGMEFGDEVSGAQTPVRNFNLKSPVLVRRRLRHSAERG